MGRVHWRFILFSKSAASSAHVSPLSELLYGQSTPQHPSPTVTGRELEMCLHDRSSIESVAELARVMREGKARFNHEVCARSYIEIYERMLDRPLLPFHPG